MKIQQISDGHWVSGILSERSNRYKNAQFREPLEHWRIAGHSEQTNEWCQKPKKMFKSDNPEKVKVILKKACCRELQCEKCVGDASSIKAELPALKLYAIQSSKDNSSPYNRVWHYSFNLYEDDDYIKEPDYKEFNKIKSKLAKILKAHGLVHFVMIFHVARIRGEDQPELYLSPHFHVLTTEFFQIHSDDFYEKYGFTYRNLEYDRNNKLKLKRTAVGVKATIAYQLNHCALYNENRKTRVFRKRLKIQDDCEYVRKGNLKEDGKCKSCLNRKKCLEQEKIIMYERTWGKPSMFYYGIKGKFKVEERKEPVEDEDGYSYYRVISDLKVEEIEGQWHVTLEDAKNAVLDYDRYLMEYLYTVHYNDWIVKSEIFKHSDEIKEIKDPSTRYNKILEFEKKFIIKLKPKFHPDQVSVEELFV